MKLTRISVFHVAISFGDTTYKTINARSHDSIDGTILKFETDEGIIGWGEVSPWGRTYLPEFAEAAREGIEVLAPALIGQDPTDLAGIHAVMDRCLNGHAYIKSAFDIGCWDILGKRAGQPIYKLLGGRTQGRIPMNCAVYNGPFEEMAERIQGYRDNGGYRIFSTKPAGEAFHDIELYRKLAEIRKPGEIFIADANRVWTIADALKVAKAIEELGFNIEQPCETYEGCLRVRRATRMTMTLDESVLDGDAMARAFRDDAADIMHLKLSRVGGLSAAARMSAFCQIAGMSLSWASSGGTEIADMAAIQAAAATPRDHLFGLWSCREFSIDCFASGAPAITDGAVEPTEAPGLGIEPDEAAFGAAVRTFN